MTKLIIVIHKMNENVKRYTRYAGNMKDINSIVYETLSNNGIVDELAIDCASWCELAPIGDSYSEEDFDVYVEED